MMLHPANWNLLTSYNIRKIAFQKISVFWVICSFFIFLQNSPNIPFPHLLRHLIVSHYCNKPFFFCIENRFICIRNKLYTLNINGIATACSVRNLNFEVSFNYAVCTVNISRYTFICAFKGIGVIFFQSKDAIIIKSIRAPFLPLAVIIEARIFTIFLYCIAKVHQNIFSFCREIDKWNPMIRYSWF